MSQKEENSINFGERLKQLRMQKGLSQVDLAKLAKVNSNHISRYERGDSKPTAKYLKILAECLGVSTDYLYDGQEEDAAFADFKDRDLLVLFKKVENLSDKDKEMVKTFLEALVTNRSIKQLANAS
jgi:transcriptional regulator with XRE-family HTH domain